MATFSNSTVNTLNVPVIGQDPSTLFKAAGKPVRVVVRNVGGSLLHIAYESTTLNNSQVIANAFRLPPGASEVFVLMPKQGLYAGAAGAGGQVSIAVSEALTMGHVES
jgi:hypothetical protein